MKKWILIAAGVVVVAVAAFLLVEKVSPVGWGFWGTYNTSSGVALKGYDPVAYHTDDQAIPGDNRFSYDWGGARWQFANAQNRDLFSMTPEAYAPEFGGFCSFAVTKGFTADIDPEAWHMEDGKLYVFANTDVRDSWVDAIGDGSIKAAEANWSKR